MARNVARVARIVAHLLVPVAEQEVDCADCGDDESDHDLSPCVLP